MMNLMIETTAPDEAGAIAATAQAVTKFRTAVRCVAGGSLPADGKVIEDRRPIG
jgi:phenylacetate-CoA ligase